METVNEEAPAYIWFNGLERSLRATRKIHQGETILTLPQATVPMPDKYSLEIYPGIHIDCSYGKAGAINHSCSPNAHVRDTRIVAWRCIESGEDITLDYKITEYKLANPFDCNCGSQSCRGRIE